MLVEDDTNLSYVTRDNLEKHGFTVQAFEDGEAAMQAFNNEKFDLCILDVMLPKLDGFSVAKAIRKQNDNIPIIFLTAKSLKEDKIAGLTLGADDYITKPFSIEELILKAEVFLKRSRAGHNAPKKEIFRIGKYLFDFHQLTLQFDEGKPVKLTLKEAELLRYFCRNENLVLKREEILKSLWGDDDYFSGRSLDVFISRLRKYLSQDKTIRIENIHSLGFRMEVAE
jgi:two-component system, OmpR family, response regulator VicR